MEKKKVEIILNLNYFDLSEFDQPGLPGSGKEFMNPNLLMVLDNMRHRADIPFKITSGYRSQEHNDKLKNSSKNSSHIKGLAVDVSATDSGSKFKIIEAALFLGIQRIGVGSNFIHIDIDDKDKPAKVCWIY